MNSISWLFSCEVTIFYLKICLSSLLQFSSFSYWMGKAQPFLGNKRSTLSNLYDFLTFSFRLSITRSYLSSKTPRSLFYNMHLITNLTVCGIPQNPEKEKVKKRNPKNPRYFLHRKMCLKKNTNLCEICLRLNVK